MSSPGLHPGARPIAAAYVRAVRQRLAALRGARGVDEADLYAAAARNPLATPGDAPAAAYTV
jgi:hypothetical protein